jgi:hypothetical protein
LPWHEQLSQKERAGLFEHPGSERLLFDRQNHNVAQIAMENVDRQRDGKSTILICREYEKTISARQMQKCSMAMFDPE